MSEMPAMTMQRSDTNMAAGDEDELNARAIAAMVAGTERTSAIILVGLMAVCIGLPLLFGIARGHPLLGIANALLLGLVGWGAALLIHVAVLNPVSAIRYARAANLLDRRIRCEAGSVALHRCWSEGSPGAITVTHDGRVRLADRSTHYRPIVLERADIRRAEAVAHYHLHQPGHPRTAFGIGLPIGGGLMATIARTPRPKAPRVSASHAVVMHYAERDNPVIRSTNIPLGGDLAGARMMAAMLQGKPD